MGYWGDSKIKSRVHFERDSSMQCVFCGEASDTREHSPSKVFLNKPLPTNLQTVPSCMKCNNSFSDDELYSVVFLKKLMSLLNYYKSTVEDCERQNSKQGKVAVNDACLFLENSIHRNARLEKIIQKLSITHAVSDLFDGYYQESIYKLAMQISYNFLPFMSENDIHDNNFDGPMYFNGIMPEMGSSFYDKILVLETILQSMGDGLPKKMMIPMLDWTEVQLDTYRYICYPDDNDIIVKIVIYEFLFISVIIKKR